MLQEIFAQLGQHFSVDKVTDFVAALLPRLIVAVAILAIYYLGWRAVSFGMKAAFKKTRVDKTAQTFVRMMVKYALFVLAVVSALGELGINTGALLTSLGIAGLTIGFAARDALSNVISGIFIFWDRPFVIGDLIEVKGHYGRVETITMRSTRVVTVDGRMLAVPNSDVVNSTVASYTNFPHLRIDVPVTTAVTEDLARTRGLLLELAAGDPRFMSDPPPAVVVTELNDYNVKVELRAWLEDEREHVPVRLALREKVFETLRSAGVDMPYQTFQLAPFEMTTSAGGKAA